MILSIFLCKIKNSNLDQKKNPYSQHEKSMKSMKSRSSFGDETPHIFGHGLFPSVKSIINHDIHH